MCGIAGLYSFEGPAPHRHLWPALVNHLHHRGPDAGGWWADGPFFLGHRRLSIIDLASGSQPMATADGGLVVTFNGEIYNYPELRRELQDLGHVFRTDSDTEVLLHGYRAWGTALPSHLTGMFAFALADRVRRELFVARDRFGEKPLFLARTPRYLAFASELRPLTALPDLPRRVHPEALAAYLLLNYVPGQQCLLDGVERLPPASWRLYGTRTERSGQYWQLTPAQATPRCRLHQSSWLNAGRGWTERCASTSAATCRSAFSYPAASTPRWWPNRPCARAGSIEPTASISWSRPIANMPAPGWWPNNSAWNWSA